MTLQFQAAGPECAPIVGKAKGAKANINHTPQTNKSINNKSPLPPTVFRSEATTSLRNVTFVILETLD